MTENTANTASRKDEHMALALDPLAQSQVDAGFDRVRLEHCALPECDLAMIDVTTEFCGRPVSRPLFIGAMTGGTDRAMAINLALAEMAESLQIGFAVGSQRAALESGQTQNALRAAAPSVPIIANLGGVQLARPDGLALAQAAIDDLEADAIAIHLNPLQEAVQPEGDTDWRGVMAAVETAVHTLSAPVMVKEVGAGLSPSLVHQLGTAGVSMIDVAGLGGTNWTRIEAARAPDAEIYAPFLDWGIPTVEILTALCDQRRSLADQSPYGIIASGGVRSGLDVAKALWLGADMVSMAGPVLTALVGAGNGAPDVAAARHAVDVWTQQLTLALFLTGAPDLGALRHVAGQITPV